MLNLDTHILVFALNGNLRPSEQTLLARHRWSVSAIVLWEVAKLVQLGRVDIDLDGHDLDRALNRIQVWPLDLAVARVSIRLDFAGDPADQIIAATSIVHNVPLLTRDRTLRRSKLVPLATHPKVKGSLNGGG